MVISETKFVMSGSTVTKVTESIEKKYDLVDFLTQTAQLHGISAGDSNMDGTDYASSIPIDCKYIVKQKNKMAFVIEKPPKLRNYNYCNHSYKVSVPRLLFLATIYLENKEIHFNVFATDKPFDKEKLKTPLRRTPLSNSEYDCDGDSWQSNGSLCTGGLTSSGDVVSAINNFMADYFSTEFNGDYGTPIDPKMWETNTKKNPNHFKQILEMCDLMSVDLTDFLKSKDIGVETDDSETK